MRWLIVTFRTTEEALQMEEYCGQQGIPGRLVPVPPAIHADCGLAFRTDPGMEAVFERKPAGMPAYAGLMMHDFRF